jgi:hypothetical protein
MILASVRKPGNPQHVATLTASGWKCATSSILADLLNSHASLSDFSPSDGDPVTCAAHAAADFIGGTVIHLRPIEAAPPGTVY